MFFRISNEQLASWSRRVGVSLEAGLDLVRVLQREGKARSGGGFAFANCWNNIAESVVQGESLYEALLLEKEQFNDLFISMVKVGEESGHLSETMLDLADYYDRLVSMKRNFMRSLTLPLFELGVALFIVGIVILILGFLPGDVDMLGLGLVGVSGLVKYLILLAFLGFGIFGLYWFTKNNAMRLKLVHYVLNFVPKIGPLLRKLSLARLTWALNLTLRTGMDVREALRLSFTAASFGPVSDNLSRILEELDRGSTLFEAFLSCNSFDETLMLHLQSGEEAGGIPEAMERLSHDYFEECLNRMKTLSVFGYFLAFFLVAGIIIFFIFRMVVFIAGMYQSVL